MPKRAPNLPAEGIAPKPVDLKHYHKAWERAFAGAPPVPSERSGRLRPRQTPCHTKAPLAPRRGLDRKRYAEGLERLKGGG